MVELAEGVPNCLGLIPCPTQAWQDLWLTCTRKLSDRTPVSHCSWTSVIHEKTLVEHKLKMQCNTFHRDVLGHI